MNTKKMLALTLATLTLVTTLAACGGKAAETTPPPSPDASEPAATPVIGIIEQNPIEFDATAHAETNGTPTIVALGYEYKDFPSLNTMLLELSAGRIAGMAMPRSVGNYLVAQDSTMLLLNREISEHYHMATRDTDTDLCEELSTAIEALEADGTLDKLATEYITTSSTPVSNALVKNEGGETHVVAITGDLPPLDYIAADGTPAGFNVALLNAIAEKTGCNFEVLMVEATARMSTLESGKADIVFWLDCWGNEDYEPTAEGVSLTTPYFEEMQCYVSTSQALLDDITAKTEASAK